MNFRIRRYRDVEICNTLQPGNQVRCVGEAIGTRNILSSPLRRIASKGYQVADSLIPILTRDIEDFVAARADACQMRRADEWRPALHPGPNIGSALTSRAVRSIGYGNKARRERCEALNRLPERRFHLGVGRRKELKRNFDWIVHVVHARLKVCLPMFDTVPLATGAATAARTCSSPSSMGLRLSQLRPCSTNSRRRRANGFS